MVGGEAFGWKPLDLSCWTHTQAFIFSLSYLLYGEQCALVRGDSGMWGKRWLIDRSISFSDTLAVMSVDLGSESMKVAIVKPGVPMEIVLNK